MNRSRMPLSRKCRKSVDKAVRRGQNTETLTASLPQERCKAHLIAKIKKHSKRTTPGSIKNRDSSPKSTHIEGVRWGKALAKQSKENTRTLTKSLLKKAHKRSSF